MPTAISSNLPLYNTGPVVEWLDIAMQRIRRYPLDKYYQNLSYSVDSAIHIHSFND